MTSYDDDEMDIQDIHISQCVVLSNVTNAFQYNLQSEIEVIGSIR